MKGSNVTCLLLFAAAIIFCSSALAQVPSPPMQPVDGPGGSAYLHGGVTRYGPYWAKHHSLDNNYKYYLFEPAKPTPANAPVVLFLHAWLAYNPSEYIYWIRHMVRKGYTVVWVQYDKGMVGPRYFAEYARGTWKDALWRLDTSTTESHVRPQRGDDGEFMTAMVGHSAGGYLAAILAAQAGYWYYNMPKPYAVVAVEPGGNGLIPAEDFGRIDASTKLLLVVGDEDDVVCKLTALRVWNSTTQIPKEDKDFLVVQSDAWGQPEQIANHYFPNNSGHSDTGTVDARDFYVTFKLSVAALNCAFKDEDCEYALGNGSAEQVEMGEWSDGTPMNPMVWAEDPKGFPMSCEK